MAGERAWRERCETCVRVSLRGCERVTDCTQRIFSESTKGLAPHAATKSFVDLRTDCYTFSLRS